MRCATAALRCNAAPDRPPHGRDPGHTDNAAAGTPDCRVRAALATGELSNRRYARYLELRAELAYVARRKDARLIAEERKL